jgi:hypothetical protein
MRLRSFRLLVFIAEALKHEQPNRRGQVALFPRQVDLGNQFRQRHLPSMRDFLQVIPEGIFKADAGLVPIDHDGAFNDRGFHEGPRKPLPRALIQRILNRAGVVQYQRGAKSTFS